MSIVGHSYLHTEFQCENVNPHFVISQNQTHALSNFTLLQTFWFK